MSERLTHLIIEDFRSIRGRVDVSLDAQVVLVHGPNGTGKTSLLSAIELALTRSVSSLGRLDPDYLKFLPHKLSGNGEARVWLEADGVPGDGKAAVIADGGPIQGTSLLDDDGVRFFSERCYLAQATLGRLLEIYEHQDSKKTDSALTRFVKEFLGLDMLDALIDGLHNTGDVRRLRPHTPFYWAARTKAPVLASDRKEAKGRSEDLNQTLLDEEASLRARLGDMVAVGAAIDAELLRPRLDAQATEIEQARGRLARTRRDIAAAAAQVGETTAADAGGVRAALEREAATSREELRRWSEGDGAALAALISAVQVRFPDAPSMSSGAAASVTAALQAVDSERLGLKR